MCAWPWGRGERVPCAPLSRGQPRAARPLFLSSVPHAAPFFVPRRNRAVPPPSPLRGGNAACAPLRRGRSGLGGHIGTARRHWRGLALRRPPPPPLSSFVLSRFPLFPCRPPLSSSGLGGGRASWARRFARFLSLPFGPASRRFLSSPSHLCLHSPPLPPPRRRLICPSLGSARVGSSHARGSRGDAPLALDVPLLSLPPLLTRPLPGRGGGDRHHLLPHLPLFPHSTLSPSVSLSLSFSLSLSLSPPPHA